MSTSTDSGTAAAAVVAAVFCALYAAHMLGDHWVQTDHQARTKSAPGRAGRWADVAHIATLTLTKLAALAALVAATGVHLRSLSLLAGLGVDALSHYWADRRTTLAALADRVGIGGFYRLGAPRRDHFLKGSTVGDKPIKVMADDNPSLGTGAYALDQSWHVAWLFVAALITAA